MICFQVQLLNSFPTLDPLSSQSKQVAGQQEDYHPEQQPFKNNAVTMIRKLFRKQQNTEFPDGVFGLLLQSLLYLSDTYH